jgi:osmotically-inducible protein OsmY
MFKSSILEKKVYIGYLTLALGLNFSTILHADYQNQNQSPNNSYSNNPNSNESYQNSSNVTDQELAKKIHDKIGPGWFSKGYDEVTVQINNGVVTLEGLVKTWEDKEKVEKEVRSIDGVKNLTSRITVQQPNTKENQQRQFAQDSYASSADDQLNKKIRDNVSRGWLWNNYKEVSLNTSNGVVTLEGVVNNVSDQQKLMNEIQKIEGVKLVKSNLRIKNR